MSLLTWGFFFPEQRAKICGGTGLVKAALRLGRGLGTRAGAIMLWAAGNGNWKAEAWKKRVCWVSLIKRQTDNNLKKLLHYPQGSCVQPQFTLMSNAKLFGLCLFSPCNSWWEVACNFCSFGEKRGEEGELEQIRWGRRSRAAGSVEVDRRAEKWSLHASLSPLRYCSPLPKLSNSMGITSGKYLLLTIM